MLRHTTQNHTDFNVCILYVSVCTSNSARMTYEMIDHERDTAQIKITLTLMYASVSSVQEKRAHGPVEGTYPYCR